MGKAMAEAFHEARDVFEQVNDALHMNLSKLMFEGPLPELTLTQNAQPALLASSMAVLKVLESGGLSVTQARVVAGHSVGEYSALVATGVISLAGGVPVCAGSDLVGGIGGGGAPSGDRDEACANAGLAKFSAQIE
jgi:malonyl CoA-acyl carrier protein transacylase